MRLSGLAKLKSQSKCSMRGSVKGERFRLSLGTCRVKRARRSMDSSAIYSGGYRVSGLIANYHQYEQPSELSPLPISSDWAGVSKSRFQNVERLSRNPSLITGSETLGFIGSFWTSRNLSLFSRRVKCVGLQRGRVFPPVAGLIDVHASQVFVNSWISFCMRFSSSIEAA